MSMTILINNITQNQQLINLNFSVWLSSSAPFRRLASFRSICEPEIEKVNDEIIEWLLVPPKC